MAYSTHNPLVRYGCALLALLLLAGVGFAYESDGADEPAEGRFEAIRALSPDEFEGLVANLDLERFRELRGLFTGKPLITTESCTDHDMGGERLAFQGSRIAGGSGVLGLASALGVGHGVGTVTDLFQDASRASAEEAVILIVDDFSRDVEWLEGHPDARQFSALSHGAQVFLHTAKIATALLGPASPVVVTFEGGSGETKIGNLTLVAVPIDPDDAGTIGDTIGRAIEDALSRQSAEGVQRIVVNMSWGLVPCGLREDFTLFAEAQRDSDQGEEHQPSFATYEAYLKAVAGQADEMYDNLCEGFDELTERLIALGSPDPAIDCKMAILHAAAQEAVEHLADDLLRAEATHFVASAGNYGLSFPIAPASWDGITSVAASNFGGPGQKARFSNDHKTTNRPGVPDCLATGAWFNLTETALQDPHTLLYAGTSFAAPAVSVAFALAIDPSSTAAIFCP